MAGGRDDGRPYEDRAHHPKRKVSFAHLQQTAGSIFDLADQLKADLIKQGRWPSEEEEGGED